MAEKKPLRLLAQDADDLGVLSAALQDAIAKIGDIRRLGQALGEPPQPQGHFG